MWAKLRALVAAMGEPFHTDGANPSADLTSAANAANVVLARIPEPPEISPPPAGLIDATRAEAQRIKPLRAPGAPGLSRR